MEKAHNYVKEDYKGNNSTFDPGADSIADSHGKDQDHGHCVGDLGDQDPDDRHTLSFSKFVRAIVLKPTFGLGVIKSRPSVGAQFVHDLYGSKTVGGK